MIKEQFSRILETQDVEGVMLFSFQGDVLFQEGSFPFSEQGEAGKAWGRFIAALEGLREADLVFEKIRLYVRKADPGYLVIVMGLFAPAAMVRMSCDMVLPSLRQKREPTGLRRFLKKKT